MMRINFAKMHGLGNDFVAIDLVSQHLKLTEKLVKSLADRHFGIGCDQLLTLELPRHPQFDFLYRVFNADGQEVGQCGNGARCIARLAIDNQLHLQGPVSLETSQSPLTVHRLDGQNYTVDMPNTVWEPASIPTTFQPKPNSKLYDLPFGEDVRPAFILSVGNPHCIFFVPELNQPQFAAVAEQLQQDKRFPKGVNVSFAQVKARNHVVIETFERGAGRTLACGSAACATVIAGQHNQELGDSVRTDFSQGHLTVAKLPDRDAVSLTGPAHCSFRGFFEIDKTVPSY